MVKTDRRFNWVQVVLIGAVLIQSIFLAANYGILWSKRVIRLLGHEAVERSAVYAFGSTFSDYMEFIRVNVPEDGLVIKPNRRFGGEIAHEGIIRYFLMPRELGDCPLEGPPHEDCLLAVRSKAYILAVGDFPSEEVIKDVMDFIPYEPENFYHGLFAPR